MTDNEFVMPSFIANSMSFFSGYRKALKMQTRLLRLLSPKLLQMEALQYRYDCHATHGYHFSVCDCNYVWSKAMKPLQNIFNFTAACKSFCLFFVQDKKLCIAEYVLRYLLPFSARYDVGLKAIFILFFFANTAIFSRVLNDVSIIAPK